MLKDVLRSLPASLFSSVSLRRRKVLPRVARTRLFLEPLEDRTAPAVATWTGAVSGAWSVAGNWSGSQPVSGAALVFPAGASNLGNTNDLPAGRLFSSITIADTGYFLSGNAIQLSGGIQDNVAGGAVIDFNIMLTASQTFAVTSGADLILERAISGTGAVTKSGAGTLFYDGNAINTYAGMTTVAAGTLVLAHNGSTAIAGNLVIGTGASVEYAFSDQLANTAYVTVNTFGTLSLNGNNDTIGGLSMYGGAVATGAGTLTVAGSITTYASDSPALISGNLDLGGAVRTVTVTNGAAGDDLVISANISNGGLSKMGMGKLILSGNSNYAGTTTVSAGIVEVQGSNALGSSAGGTSVSAGATLQLGQDGLTLNDALTLNGNGVGGLGALRHLSTGTTSTWAGNIVLATTSRVSVSSATVGTLFLTGAISGMGGLTKVGNSALELGGSGDNTFTGTTTVNEGGLFLNKTGLADVAVRTLVIGDGIGNDFVALIDSDQILDTAAVTINSSGQLTLFNVDDAIGSLTMTGGTVFTGTGVLILGGNMTSNASGVGANIDGNLDLGGAVRNVTVADGAAADDLVISAVISNGGLTKMGGGKLALSGANTYAGATTVSAGILAVRNNSALGTTAAGTTVASGASLVMDFNGVTIADDLTLNGTGVASGGALQLRAATGNTTGNVTLGSAVSISVAALGTLGMGTGLIGGPVAATLTKVGAGNLILGGSNTYLGTTTISAGTLIVGNDAALGATTAGTTVAAGASLALDGSLGISNVPENVTLNGTGMLGTGALQAAGNTLFTLSGSVMLASTSSVSVYGSTFLEATGVISGAGGLSISSGALMLSGAAANTFTGTTTVNAGTLTLNKTAGVNAIAGPLVIGDGTGTDTVRLSASDQIANTAAVTINSSGTLDLNGFNETISSLTLTAGAVTTGAGTLTPSSITSNGAATPSSISGNLNLGGATRTITVADGAAADDLVITAVISNGALIKSGVGKLVLAGANTYVGATVVAAGTLAIRNNNALGTTAAGTAVQSGATLALDGGGLFVSENLTLNGTGVAGAGALQQTAGTTSHWLGSVALASAASMGAGSGIFLEVDGVISGPAAASLTKVGSGVLILSGISTYAGATNINGGILAAVNAAGSATGTGIVTVNNTGTLAGDGTVGNVVVKAGGILLPSTGPTSPGTLTTGSVYFHTGAIFRVIIDAPGFSQLNVTGTVTINNATLDVDQANAGALNDTYAIISNDGGDSVIGTFGTFTGDFNPNYSIAYNTGVGFNDVVLTQIV